MAWKNGMRVVRLVARCVARWCRVMCGHGLQAARSFAVRRIVPHLEARKRMMSNGWWNGLWCGRLWWNGLWRIDSSRLLYSWTNVMWMMLWVWVRCACGMAV